MLGRDLAGFERVVDALTGEWIDQPGRLADQQRSLGKRGRLEKVHANRVAPGRAVLTRALEHSGHRCSEREPLKCLCRCPGASVWQEADADVGRPGTRGEYPAVAGRGDAVEPELKGAW